MNSLPDTWLVIYEEHSSYTVTADQEPRINAAVQEYVDSGKTRDRLLELEMLDGRVYYTLASIIQSWCISTPETRERHTQLEQMQKEEDQRLRRELGIWEDS